MVAFTPDQWIILGLVFLLGLFVGLFMLAGRGKKWKTLYREEVARREAIEADYSTAQSEWRERDSLRAAALKNRGVDVDRDGIDDRLEPGRQHPVGRGHDVDRDGIDDRVEPGRQHPPGMDPHDVDRDGIDDRIEPGIQRPR